MADGPFDPQTGELISRPPERSDLVELCRQLQERGASFMIVGGFAMILAGYARTTGDIDLLIDTDLENEARVYDALATLPDGCARHRRSRRAMLRRRPRFRREAPFRGQLAIV